MFYNPIWFSIVRHASFLRSNGGYVTEPSKSGLPDLHERFEFVQTESYAESFSKILSIF